MPFTAVSIHKQLNRLGRKFLGAFILVAAVNQIEYCWPILSCNAATLSRFWCTQTTGCDGPQEAAMVDGGLFRQALSKKQQQPQLIFDNVTIGPKFSPNPMKIRGVSGGSVAASQVADLATTPTGRCLGFVDQQPDHTVVLTTFFSHLSIQVESPKDTTIVIRGPGGSWCNDDFEGKNPGITGDWLAGTYQIWVGSYKKNDYQPYILNIKEVP